MTDVQWEMISHFFVRSAPRVAREKYEKRAIVNAILYVVKGGIVWRMLPNDLPPWDTVYDHYRKWCKRGVWETVLDELNLQLRQKVGRAATPTYGIVDSQSVKTQYKSEERWIDGSIGKIPHHYSGLCGCWLRQNH
jgi:putative transposase